MDVSHWIDRASDTAAREFLTRCCGSRRWVNRMLANRPFGDDNTLFAIARDEWFSSSPTDWREAFSHHPKIGDRSALAARFPSTAHLSSEEQRGVREAPDETLDALARLNSAYEEKFGFIFIVCATGKTADEMLALLKQRFGNDADTEVKIAAQEQWKITELRLRRIPGAESRKLTAES